MLKIAVLLVTLRLFVGVLYALPTPVTSSGGLTSSERLIGMLLIFYSDRRILKLDNS